MLSSTAAYFTANRKEMAPAEPRPPFATYLLPPFNYPFRRRESSTTSTSSEVSVPSLYSSPTSSPGTTPSSSPPNALFTLPHWKGKGILYEAFHKDALRSNTSDSPALQAPKKLCRANPNTLKCLTCATDIAFTSQVVSKGFTGRHGRAYLVSPPLSAPYNWKTKTKPTADLVNITVGRAVNRDLLTGAHVVADVSCTICGIILGWKYVNATELAQRYKIGKFILEMKRVVLGVSWEDTQSAYEDGESNALGVYEPVEAGKLSEVDELGGDVVFDSEDEDECDDLFAGVWDAEAVSKRRGRRVVVRRKHIDEEEEAV